MAKNGNDRGFASMGSDEYRIFSMVGSVSSQATDKTGVIMVWKTTITITATTAETPLVATTTTMIATRMGTMTTTSATTVAITMEGVDSPPWIATKYEQEHSLG